MVFINLFTILPTESFVTFMKRNPRGRDSNLRKYYRCLSKAHTGNPNNVKKAPSSEAAAATATSPVAAAGEEEAQEEEPPKKRKGGRPKGSKKRVWNLEKRNVPKRQSAVKLEEGWATKTTPIG